MSVVIINGHPVDVAGGGDEILRLRALLEQRNEQKRNLKSLVAEKIGEKLSLIDLIRQMATETRLNHSPWSSETYRKIQNAIKANE